MFMRLAAGSAFAGAGTVLAATGTVFAALVVDGEDAFSLFLFLSAAAAATVVVKCSYRGVTVVMALICDTTVEQL
jgi:hypothetical protein